MKKSKPKHYWNHRVVTKIIPGSIANDLTKGTITKLSDERVFSIVEVYYNNGKPDSYTESKSLLNSIESVKALKWAHKKIKKAFKKPILDLDHWPNEWKED